MLCKMAHNGLLNLSLLDEGSQFKADYPMPGNSNTENALLPHQKHRQTQLSIISRPVVFRIVHGSDVHFARSEFRIRDRHHRERYVNHRSYDIDTAPLCRLASLAF